jgi:hypothetical protein
MKEFLLITLKDLDYLKYNFNYFDKITIDLRVSKSLYYVLSYAIKYSYWAVKLDGIIDIKTKKYLTSVFSKKNLAYWQVSSTLHYSLTNNIETMYSNKDEGYIKIKKIQDPYLNNGISFGIIASGAEEENDFLLNSINSIRNNKEIKKFKYEIIILVKSNNKLSSIIKNKSNIKILFFDDDREGDRFMIGRKKNKLYELCQYDIVSISHARIIFPNNLIQEILTKKFDFITTKINTIDDDRYLDIGLLGTYNISKPTLKLVRTGYFIPNFIYNLLDGRCIYIDGGLSIYNKKVLNFNPFNKYLAWGEGEDIRVSEQISTNGFLVDYYDYLTSRSQSNKTKRKNNIKTKLKLFLYDFFNL